MLSKVLMALAWFQVAVGLILSAKGKTADATYMTAAAAFWMAASAREKMAP